MPAGIWGCSPKCGTWFQGQLTAGLHHSVMHVMYSEAKGAISTATVTLLKAKDYKYQAVDPGHKDKLL